MDPSPSAVPNTDTAGASVDADRNLAGGLGLEPTVGSLYFAAMFSMGLWGAGTIQLYIYYNNYSKDTTWLKSYVFAVWFLDTLHQALLICMAHGYLIVGFGNYEALMHLDPFLVAALLVGGFICTLVQAIFIMRIWKLSEKNLFLVIFVSALVLAQLTATCLYFAKAVQSSTFAELMGAMIITRIVNSLTAAADSAIALCLVVLLYRATRRSRSRSGNDPGSGREREDSFQSTERQLINRLILFTINTGLITSLCAVLGLVLGFVLFDTLLFMFFYLTIARLYTNSLLAALNSRNSLRRGFIKSSPVSASRKVPTLRELKIRTYQQPSDDHSPEQLILGQQTLSEGDTATVRQSARLDTFVNNTFSSESFYSQSLYSVVLDDLESVQTTPIKSEYPRTHSSENWI